MDLGSVADELYGSARGDFVRLRAAREKEAKSAGDKDLAAQIRRLGKPSEVGWLANQLARKHADEIRQLLALGDGLREATASMSGDDLRELMRQQRVVVHALVKQGAQLAADAGRRVSDETARGLDETLLAAMADPAAGTALVAGRLTSSLRYSGFAAGPDPGRPVVAATPPARPAPPAPADDLAVARRQKLIADLARAEAAAAEADRVLTSARDESDRSVQAAAHAVAEADRLAQELASARKTVTAAQAEVLEAQSAYERAEHDRRSALETRDDVTALLDRMGD